MRCQICTTKITPSYVEFMVLNNCLYNLQIILKSLPELLNHTLYFTISFPSKSDISVMVVFRRYIFSGNTYEYWQSLLMNTILGFQYSQYQIAFIFGTFDISQQMAFQVELIHFRCLNFQRYFKIIAISKRHFLLTNIMPKCLLLQYFVHFLFQKITVSIAFVNK